MILNRILHDREWKTPLGDFEEFYNEYVQENSLFKAYLWYWGQIIKLFTQKIMHTLCWRAVMFKNYMKVAFRNLFRYRGYTSLNIIGLAAGIACCIYILLYVQFELSYDTYHKDTDRIYRVAKSVKTKAGTGEFASVSVMMAPALKENFPQVEHAVRIRGQRDSAVRQGDKIFKEEGKKLIHIDPDIFKIFDIPFIQGDPSTALERPFTAVITQDIANKYFGNENPVGKTITVDTVNYEITGIMENPPGNTHIQYAFLMSWKTIENHEWHQGWQPMNVPTYIKLAEGVDPVKFAEQISLVARENMKEDLAQSGGEYTSFLQPIESIHLHSNLIWELGTPGNPHYIYIFSAVGVLILLIAGMNFINLSTARSANRSGEVGMRKVVGAQRVQLIWQFIGESTFISVIALIVALLLVIVSMPFYNDLAGTRFTLTNLIQPGVLISFLVLVLFIGIVAGSYPALFLSAFKPVSVLRGNLSAGSRGSVMRKILVIGQFALSITLIIGTILFYQQLHFMKNKSLGFDKEQKLIINMQGNSIGRNNFQLFKEEFLKHPSVAGATFSSSVPGRWRYLWRQYPTGEEATNANAINCMQVDHDFITEYGLEIIAGRAFKREMSTDESDRGYILNEAAVKAFGWNSPEEALTKTLRDERVPVLGVLKDYHFRGLQSTIEPLGIFLMVEDYRYLSLKVKTEELGKTISYVENKYKELFPDKVFDYFFLDADFNSQYHSEERIGKIFSVFTFFGLFIACLGLFGLASFIAEQRTKEIGIRKVLGSSIIGIIALLTKEFVKWVGAGTIIAWPAAYFAVSIWLRDFAYRISPGWSSFILAALAALIIALLTVSYQAVKAATANPVEALKYE